MRSKIILWFICFFSPVLIVSAQEKKAIDWITFEQLSDSLATNPKKTVIFFHTDWCVYCRKMEQEIFTKPEIFSLINEQYYAVQMDAESVDTVRFDGQRFTNSVPKKTTGKFHELALLLGQREGQFTVPVLLVLDENFFVKGRYFEYLDSRKLIRILKKR